MDKFTFQSNETGESFIEHFGFSENQNESHKLEDGDLNFINQNSAHLFSIGYAGSRKWINCCYQSEPENESSNGNIYLFNDELILKANSVWNDFEDGKDYKIEQNNPGFNIVDDSSSDQITNFYFNLNDKSSNVFNLTQEDIDSMTFENYSLSGSSENNSQQMISIYDTSSEETGNYSYDSYSAQAESSVENISVSSIALEKSQDQEVMTVQAAADVQTEAQSSSDSDGGVNLILLIAAIVLAVVAVAGVCSSVLLFMKNKKSEKKIKDINRSSLQAKSEFDMVSRNKQELEAEINSLKSQLKNTYSEENYNNAVVKLRSNIEERDREIEDLKNSLESKQEEINRLKEKLEKAAKEKVVVRSRANTVKKDEQSDTENTPYSDSDSIFKKAALSKEFLNSLISSRNIDFVSINTDMIGNNVLGKTTNHMIAPLVSVDNMLTINPYYFNNLSSGRESIQNIRKLAEWFDIEETENLLECHLKDIEPARIKSDVDDILICTERGRIIV